MLAEQQLNKLQKIQTNCVDLTDKTKKLNTSKFKENKILTVQNLVHLECSKFGYKILNNLLPKNLQQLLCSDQHAKMRLDTKKALNMPRVKGKWYSNSFLSTALRDIQPLLAITQSSPNLSSFTSKLKSTYFTIGDNG